MLFRRLATCCVALASLMLVAVPAMAGRIYIPAEAAIYPNAASCSSEKHNTTSGGAGVTLLTVACGEDEMVFFKVAYPSDAPTSGTPFTADINWAKYGNGDSETVCWQVGTYVVGAGGDTDTILSGSWTNVAVSDAGIGDSLRNVATTGAFLPANAVGDGTLYVRVWRDTGACGDTENTDVPEIIDITLKY